MSKLGEYVHYNWKNYRIYGTSRTGPSNFDPLIFSHHRTQVGREILRTKEIANLEALEVQYNDGAKLLNQFLEQVIKNKHFNNNKNFLKNLLSSISNSYTEISDYIIEGLDYDPSRERVIFKPKVSLKQLAEDEKTADALLGSLKREKGIYIDTLIKHLGAVESRISKLDDGDLKNSLMNSCIGYRNDLQLVKEGNSKAAEALRTITYGSYKGGFLSYARDKDGILTPFLEGIQLLTTQITSSIRIQNKIGAELAEIMGTVTSENINNLTKVSLKKALRDFAAQHRKTAGSTNTTPWMRRGANGLEKSGISTIGLEIREIDLEELFNEKTSHVKAITKREGKEGDISYSVEAFSDQKQQKADFVATLFDGTKAGVSMKNYDMSAIADIETRIGTKIPNSVDLQSSSLALYLAALELKRTPGNLGNHYLQILSGQRGYESGRYSTEIQAMRRQANQALSLYILWSAMTGRGQGRGVAGQFADILAIYDKAKSSKEKFRRIRLYSVRDILLDLLNASPEKFEGAAVFSPQISKIQLDNARVGDAPNKDDAQKRISRLVVHAKSQIIAVSLSKIYLNSFAVK